MADAASLTSTRQAGDSAGPTATVGLLAAELVRVQYRNLPAAIVVNLVISALLCIALRETVSAERLLLWLLALYAVSIARFVGWTRFQKARPSAADSLRWRRLAVLASGVSGTVWGLGGIVLYAPHSPGSQFLLLITEFGMGAGSLYVSAPAFGAVMAYLVPSVLLTSIPYFVEGDSVHVTLGAMLFVFVAAATHFTHGISRSIARGVGLQFENIDLIRELRRQTGVAEQARLVAEDASVAKSRFFAAAGHDLRQPLHALGFFVDALQEYPLPPDGRSVVANIRRSVDAMEDSFNSLLELSRLDAGIVQPRVATVALDTLLERVRQQFEPVAAQKGLQLGVVRNSLYVRTDPILLERILRNLVANAVRFTDLGRVLIGARRSASTVTVQVWDTGRGIPPERHREIFLEFAQPDSTRAGRRHGGLGLGLAIAERLAKLLEHPLQLRSEPERGSVFGICMPRGHRDQAAPEDAAGQLIADRDVANSLILLVDDEPEARNSVVALLDRWRCQVIAAESCAEMLEKLGSVQRMPDLIVSDYRLPGEDNGIAVVARLREEFNSQVPALLITGDTGIEPLQAAAESSLHVLHKPLNPSRLRALIATLRRERIRAA